jgi:pimeloyl-ACP methyl ester carboxylesterase
MRPDGTSRPGARDIATYLDLRRSLRPPIWRELVPDWRLARNVTDVVAIAARAARPRNVVIVPGFLATDHTSALLSRALRRSGHRVARAGLGITNGCSEVLATRLIATLERCGAEAGPLTLIGHSRGGQLAKVAATRRPDLIETIVTLGSPLTDQWASHVGLKLLIATFSELSRHGVDLGGCGDDQCPFGPCSVAFTRDLVGPIPDGVTFTSIFSRRDGVVQWTACRHPSARHVEVRAAHLQMGVHPDVVRAIVSELHGADAVTTA